MAKDKLEVTGWEVCEGGRTPEHSYPVLVKFAWGGVGIARCEGAFTADYQRVKVWNVLYKPTDSPSLVMSWMEIPE